MIVIFSNGVSVLIVSGVNNNLEFRGSPVRMLEVYTCFGPSQLSCRGSSAGRALCLECRVSWVRVPSEAAHFS